MWLVSGIIEALAELRSVINARAVMAGKAAEIDRPDHVTAHIGSPPLGLEARRVWRTVAAEIESYRARWGQEPDLAAPALAGEQQRHLELVRDAVGQLEVDSSTRSGTAIDLS